MKLSKLACLVLGVTSFISGCSTVKLGEVPKTRENYNLAIDNSENQQFLLNIVRMHYGRSPYFISVDSVTTSSSLSTNLALDNLSNAMGMPGSMPGLNWGISPNVTFTEAPTITYTPLQGTKFISGMMTPIEITRIGMLKSSGWNMNTVLDLTISRIGRLSNDDVSHHASGVDNDGAYEDPLFDKYVELLAKLGQANRIEFSSTSYESSPAILLQAKDQDAAKQISQSLQLKHVYSQFIFTRNALDLNINAENIIPIKTRSLLGVMNYLSLGVQNPSVSGVKAKSEKYEDNFHVLSSDKEPDNASVKIRYDDDKWYYIPNSDAHSKAMMVLLKLIYSLQLGDIKTNLPVVTIPVNQ
ncbi:MAG: hypothetical protein RLZZ293_736 [Pseudomonadota bacterium]|jgi:hypothetical protein